MIESCGTDKCETKAMSVEGQRALSLINDSIRKQDDHHEMKLLWKDENPVYPYNRLLAEARRSRAKN